MSKKTKLKKNDENIYTASQAKLMWWRFKKNKPAVIGLIVVALLYAMAFLAPFLAPYTGERVFSSFKYVAPASIQYTDDSGAFRFPGFLYGMKAEMNPNTFAREYVVDKTQRGNIKFFVKGESYKLFGLFQTDIHLFGTDNESIPVFLFGTDSLGRDMFSRIMYGSQISLSIGLVGIFVTFFLGILIGGVAAHYGGTVDNTIQRLTEIIMCVPTLPLWMALSAAIPATWPPLGVYFGISLVLSAIGWTGLARVVRGKFMSMKNLDFITAARLAGKSQTQITFQHMLPSFMSYIIISLTGSVPGMIMGETALSFLGLGLKPPIVSWGVLLQESKELNALALRPWLLFPSLFLILTVLAFNFMGDGLREAADPYSSIN